MPGAYWPEPFEMRNVRQVRLLSTLLALILTLAACSVAPMDTAGTHSDSFRTSLDLSRVDAVAQIGLLAPFEGLERRSGYSALEDLRHAIQELAPGDPLLPLALDTSLDAARAAQKLLLSPDLAAVLGPLSPHALPSVSDGEKMRTLGEGRWLAPFAVTPAGFVAPDEPAWLYALLEGVADLAAKQGASRLRVEGWDGAGFGSDLDQDFVMPVVWQSQVPLELQVDDAILWLGDGAGGAQRAGALRMSGAQNALWLAPWAADDPFFEHLRAATEANVATSDQIASAGRWDAVYSTAWVDLGYHGWAADNPTQSPELYVQAAAAAQSVTRVVDDLGNRGDDRARSEAGAEQSADTWSLRGFRVTSTGERKPIAP